MPFHLGHSAIKTLRLRRNAIILFDCPAKIDQRPRDHVRLARLLGDGQSFSRQSDSFLGFAGVTLDDAIDPKRQRFTGAVADLPGNIHRQIRETRRFLRLSQIRLDQRVVINDAVELRRDQLRAQTEQRETRGADRLDISRERRLRRLATDDVPNEFLPGQSDDQMSKGHFDATAASFGFPQ